MLENYNSFSVFASQVNVFWFKNVLWWWNKYFFAVWFRQRSTAKRKTIHAFSQYQCAGRECVFLKNWQWSSHTLSAPAVRRAEPRGDLWLFSAQSQAPFSHWERERDPSAPVINSLLLLHLSHSCFSHLLLIHTHR